MTALVLAAAMLAAPPLLAQSRDLGGGFIDHGPFASIFSSRGRYYMAARAPEGVELGNGGAYLDGRLYFAGGVRLLSWPVPAAD